MMGNYREYRPQDLKGIYTLSTQLLNPRKTAGDPYDFRNRKLLNNFQLYINPNLTQKSEIFSTGREQMRKRTFQRV
jgi:hypothetical protein